MHVADARAVESEDTRAAASTDRNAAVDVVRGAVMVLMALDHARDFFGDGSRSPTDLSTTTPALFFTRWVTHFCAPVFVFLAGTAAFLSGRKKTPAELSRFLVTRGVWLIVLELTIVRAAWFFDVSYHFTVLQVIWVIGCSMIVLAALIHLPLRAIVPLALVMIAGHDLFDRVDGAHSHMPAWLWAVLHEFGAFEPLPGRRLMVIYPLVPWIAVMAAGYAFGAVVQRPRAERRPQILRLGIALTLAFIVLRAFNHYGDPRPYAVQSRPFFTVMSFLNCSKYPPSLLYLLMTLGPALIVLALIDHDSRRDVRGDMRPNAIARAIAIYGKVPLFYYVMHLFVLHGAAIALTFALHGAGALNRAFFMGGGLRLSLPAIYLAWIVGVASLYLPSRWYGALKARRRDLAWLSYL